MPGPGLGFPGDGCIARGADQGWNGCRGWSAVPGSPSAWPRAWRGGAGIHFRPAGELILKGKSEPTPAFQPLSAEEAASPWTAAYLEAYRLLAGASPEARDAFAAVVEGNPADSLAKLHLGRIEDGETGVVIRLKVK